MTGKDELYAYLRQNKYMALATATASGVPEVATVEYVVDGDSLLMNTFKSYRKYPNMIANNRVAGVVTTGHERTLQFDAVAIELQRARKRLRQSKKCWRMILALQNTLKIKPGFSA